MTYGAETWTSPKQRTNYSSRTNKDGNLRSMLNITDTGTKNIWLREKTKVTDVIEQVRTEDGSGPGQGTAAGYEVINGHCLSPLRNHSKARKRVRGRPARSWRDELNEYWKGTIWQRIALDRQMYTCKQHICLKPSPNHMDNIYGAHAMMMIRN